MDSGQIKRYFQARILRNHDLFEGELWTANGKIIPPQPQANVEINMNHKILSPGYIDLQINGAFGVDFSSEADRIAEVVKRLPQYGVTSFLPTIVSLPKERYPLLMSLLQPTPGGKHGAAILGIHLEGPFFNKAQSGAHNSLLMRSFEGIGDIEAWYGNLQGVKIITLAPELPGAIEAIRSLIKKDVVVAAGHTLANEEQIKEGIKSGVTIITHLFNATTPFQQRSPGVIGATLTDDSVFYSLIVDGIHLHPDTIKMAWRAHPNGLVLVTDAIEALGLPSGFYHLGTMDIFVEGGAAHVSGTRKIAGSVLSLDKAVRNFRSITACSIVEAIEAATLKPAQVLGMEQTKGTLNIGADADFNVMDDDLHVQACYVSGELAWQK